MQPHLCEGLALPPVHIQPRGAAARRRCLLRACCGGQRGGCGARCIGHGGSRGVRAVEDTCHIQSAKFSHDHLQQPGIRGKTSRSTRNDSRGGSGRSKSSGAGAPCPTCRTSPALTAAAAPPLTVPATAGPSGMWPTCWRVAQRTCGVCVVECVGGCAATAAAGNPLALPPREASAPVA